MRVGSIDLKLIKALNSVINEQSFEKAAHVLNLTQPAVSQRIKLLEQYVAKPVLIRSIPPEATKVGEQLIAYYKKVKTLEYELIDEISPNANQNILEVSIALNADTLASWFIPAIANILKYSPMALDLRIENETRTQELLKKGEVFAAISSKAHSFAGCKVQAIGKVDYICCASPEFKQRYFSEGLTIESLQSAPGVLFNNQDSMHTDYIEKHFGIKKGVYPCHRVKSSEAFVAMALTGSAYCLLPHTQAHTYIEDGALIDLFPQQHIKQTLYWHSWVLEQGIQKRISEEILMYGHQFLK